MQSGDYPKWVRDAAQELSVTYHNGSKATQHPTQSLSDAMQAVAEIIQRHFSQRNDGESR